MPFSRPPFSRRDFLGSAAALAAAAVLAPPLSRPLDAAPRFSANPFPLGVASGDPLPDGVVLWTRLAADLADPESWGLAEPSYKLIWAIYDAEAGGRALQTGDVIAAREKGYAVHVEVKGLAPGRRYKYRFWCGDEESPGGLTRTAPAADAPPGKLRFGFCSCAEYENEFFHAYRAMADDNLDFAVHLGDYIYEQPYEHFRIGAGRPTARRLRFDRYDDNLQPIRLSTLAQFRRRYAEYRIDADLQEAHRVMPWIVTWDDHEVDNDYAALIPLSGDAAEFEKKRINAYQAYFENMPIRLSALPLVNGARQLYRRFDFGRLMRLHVLDERQYRAAQACKATKQVDPALCPELAGEREMLGREQLAWLEDGLDKSPALWNVLAQGVMFTPADSRLKDEDSPKVWYDAWSGYPWAQANVMTMLEAQQAKNPVIISGDIHSHWVTRVRRRGADGAWGPPIAPEFVCTAISSSLNDMPDAERRNADVVTFHNGRRHGYCLTEASASELKTTMVMMVKDPRDPARRPVADYGWAYKVEPGKPQPRRA